MAIILTDTAIEKIYLTAMKRQALDHVFRIGIRGGGCSGFSYFVNFEKEQALKDKIFEFECQSGKIKVVIDMKSYLFLNDITVDWKEDLMKTGFEFINPAAKSTCGCGESFTV